MVQPAVPFRWDAGSFDCPGVDNPTALAVFRLIVAVAEIVFANGGAGKPSREKRAGSRVHPPDKKLTKPGHHGTPNLRADYRSGNTAATILMRPKVVDFMAILESGGQTFAIASV